MDLDEFLIRYNKIQNKGIRIYGNYITLDILLTNEGNIQKLQNALEKDKAFMYEISINPFEEPLHTFIGLTIYTTHLNDDYIQYKIEQCKKDIIKYFSVHYSKVDVILEAIDYEPFENVEDVLYDTQIEPQLILKQIEDEIRFRGGDKK